MTNAVNIAQSGSNNVTFRNRIINGAMVIDQRYAGAATANTISGYVIDRWQVLQSTTGKLIAQQNAGSVTPPVGFTNYFGVTSQSAYSVGATDYYLMRQIIEGSNLSDLGWGTANAKTVTISFWVRSSLTGAFGLTISNYSGVRYYPSTYTINSANTWEYKTVTIPGDTSGTWLTNNTGGPNIDFAMGVGSTYSGTVNTWGGGSFIFAATGSTSVVGTNGATFYITGVQLEAGTTASPFEYRQYGTELALCQRYFYTIPANSVGLGGWGNYYNATSGTFFYYNPVTMRSGPTVSNITGTIAVLGVNNTVSCTITSDRTSVNMLQFGFTGATSLAAGYPVSYNGSTVIQVSSEL